MKKGLPWVFALLFSSVVVSAKTTPQQMLETMYNFAFTPGTIGNKIVLMTIVFIGVFGFVDTILMRAFETLEILEAATKNRKIISGSLAGISTMSIFNESAANGIQGFLLAFGGLNLVVMGIIISWFVYASIRGNGVKPHWLARPTGLFIFGLFLILFGSSYEVLGWLSWVAWLLGLAVLGFSFVEGTPLTRGWIESKLPAMFQETHVPAEFSLDLDSVPQELRRPFNNFASSLNNSIEDLDDLVYQEDQKDSFLFEIIRKRNVLVLKKAKPLLRKKINNQKAEVQKLLDADHHQELIVNKVSRRFLPQFLYRVGKAGREHTEKRENALQDALRAAYENGESLRQDLENIIHNLENQQTLIDDIEGFGEDNEDKFNQLNANIIHIQKHISEVMKRLSAARNHFKNEIQEISSASAAQTT